MARNSQNHDKTISEDSGVSWDDHVIHYSVWSSDWDAWSEIEKPWDQNTSELLPWRPTYTTPYQISYRVHWFEQLKISLIWDIFPIISVKRSSSSWLVMIQQKYTLVLSWESTVPTNNNPVVRRSIEEKRITLQLSSCGINIYIGIYLASLFDSD